MERQGWGEVTGTVVALESVELENGKGRDKGLTGSLDFVTTRSSIQEGGNGQEGKSNEGN